MKQKQLVVLFGDSLFMDAIEAGLGVNREFGLVRIYARLSAAGKQLQSFQPDIVIFDVLNLDDHTALTLLKEQPGILFLGLDIDSNQIVALRSQYCTVRSLADLTGIIRQQNLPPDDHAIELLTLDQPLDELIKR